MESIIRNLDQIIKFDTFTSNSIQIDELLPFDIKNYYNYQGSLTTPNCDEVVEWFIVDEPVIGISEEQLLDFQSIEAQNEMPVSFRVKKLNFIS